MKKVILDTDIGVDCDDAAAIGVLLELERRKVCDIKGITTSTTREGAAETVQAILDYYGVEKRIGVMHNPVLACDETNMYARALKEKYGCKGTKTDAVELLRTLLAETEEKVTLIAIGPLSNIANLLRTPADAISPLSGQELLEQRVESLYIMGGSFTQYDVAGTPNGGAVMQEWNILQDIESAAYVMEHCPCEMVLCPFEVGNRVFTTMREGANPVWYAMRCYGGTRITPENPHFARESWDPVTCLAALQDCSEYVTISEQGFVRVEKDGTTNFKKDISGKTRFLKDKGSYDAFGSWIDSLLVD